MKAVKLLVLFLFCMGEMHAIGIDSIQTYVEINRIKVLVEWSGYGCYHPTDSVILDDASGEVRIYRTETVPECDMVTHNRDSFYVEQGAFDELKIQLYKRSMSEGTEEMPIYGDYFLTDNKTLRLRETVYFPEGTIWTEVTTNLIDKSYCVINTYEVTGDTTINGTVYRKVLLNGKALYALREQDDKVYLMFLMQEKERLAYDFAWEVGKTLYYQFMESTADEYVPMCTLQEISQVRLMDGLLYDYAEGCIRGIGGEGGIFEHMLPQPTNGDQTCLLCFSRNNMLIYQNQEYADCKSCGKNGTKQDHVDMPSPVKFANNVLYFSFTQQGARYLTIYNSTGGKVLSRNIEGMASLPISGLGKGIYHYQITGSKPYTGTFICL